jgi:hypothetical protein
MAVTVSAVLLFGIALFFLLRSKSLGVGAALIAVLFGFYLAQTGVATPIRHAVAAIATDLSHIH